MGQTQTYLAPLAVALRTPAAEWMFPDGGRVGRLARLDWKEGDQTLFFPVTRSTPGAAQAELWSQMTQIQAEVNRLEQLLREDGALERFLAISELVSPTLPESPLSPKPLAYGTLAALAVLLLGLLWVFFSAALREERG